MKKYTTKSFRDIELIEASFVLTLSSAVDDSFLEKIYYLLRSKFYIYIYAAEQITNVIRWQVEDSLHPILLRRTQLLLELSIIPGTRYK